MSTYIIAEAGVNHNGSQDLALRLVRAAAEAGATAVKFQTFKASDLTLAAAPKAEYQKRSTGTDESQQEMLRKLELSTDDHRQLQAECTRHGIEFLSSPFDLRSLAFLAEAVHLPKIKLGSGEITNGPLLLAAAQTGLPIILSTGMSVLEEIEQALAVLAWGYRHNSTPDSFRQVLDAWHKTGPSCLAGKVDLLHCVTDYPTPFTDVNLRAMDTLRAAFSLPVGFSDHTPGIIVPIAAVARGAHIVEKHLTLDRTMRGPDHAASLQPEEFAAMVTAIHDVEEALGSSEKKPTAHELSNLRVARKSVVTATTIAAGELFTKSNLTTKRPATGASPMQYWDLINHPAARDYGPDELPDELVEP